MNMTYRIYPDVDQQAMMLEWLETCRRLYNRCLRDLKDWINSRKCSIDRCSLEKEYIMSASIPFPSYLEQKRQLTQWKKEDDYLKAVHSQVTQDVVKRMHNTWESFKDRGYGFPRFKKYGQYRSFLFPQFKDNPITGYQIKLPKIGDILINQHRPIPNGFKVKQIRVLSRCRGTKWYVIVTVQSDASVPEPLPYGRGVGIDIGLENFLTTSDNFTVEPAKFFRELQSRLKVLQRKASRQKKRSKNWEKAQIEVAELHHKIANCRKNFHFQTAHLLCDQADMIFVEDINFRVSAKGFLSKSMLDGAFGQFRNILSWVCWKRGKYFAQVDHKFTSQICPKCQTHTGKKPLSQRVHECPECSYQTTRDHASAEVILQRGLEKVGMDVAERKQSDNGVLSGVLYLDKCRCRNAQLRS
ncbi:RNA-guided endonuclease InsQ/TnpB family protein [Gloeothece verrucosa]|uniref:Putative transposase IS891/IS1136/IS1341 family n=1 Tax=Gloeothece verrucosa (strain PCC 7822) TaxID=497965 RepID=E0UED2_GLOV7|nr:RNA-guided endonuclease TnpB family protein [Gloeothece verrucosa]ADN15378.1 putative transposase IS891/IS1136/IS1341 family [Gloeothece verrucosa PCC 7822]